MKDNSRGLWPGVLVLLGVLGLQIIHLGQPWDASMWGFDGSGNALGVRNWFAYSLEVHRGVQVRNGHPAAGAALEYYARTPMPYFWLCALGPAVFGVQAQWAYQLVPMLHGLALAGLVLLLVRDLRDVRTGLLAAFFAACTPMVGYFSTCLSSFPSAVYWVATLWAYRQWQTSPRRGTLLVLAGCWAAACFSQHANLFLAPGLVLLHWLQTRRVVRFALVFGAYTGVLLALNLAHSLVVPGAIDAWLEKLQFWTVEGSGHQGAGLHLLVAVKNAVYTCVRLYTPVIVLLAVAGLWPLHRARNATAARQYVGALLVGNGLFYAVMRKHTFIHEQDFYYLAPAAGWLAAEGLGWLGRQRGWPAAVAGGAGAVLVVLFYRGNVQCYYQPLWPAGTALLAAVPVVVLAVWLVLPVGGRLRGYALVALLVAVYAAGWGYTATLWGDRESVRQGRFVQAHTAPEQTVAWLGTYYRLDRWHARRVLVVCDYGSVSERLSPAQYAAWLKKHNAGAVLVDLPLDGPANRRFVEHLSTTCTRYNGPDCLLFVW